MNIKPLKLLLVPSDDHSGTGHCPPSHSLASSSHPGASLGLECSGGGGRRQRRRATFFSLLLLWERGPEALAFEPNVLYKMKNAGLMQAGISAGWPLFYVPETFYLVKSKKNEEYYTTKFLLFAIGLLGHQ